MRSPLRAYISATTAVGGLALVASVVSLYGAPYRFEWMLLAAVALIAGVFPVQTIGSTEASISVADTFFITCAVLFGPGPATIAIATDSLLMSLLRRRHGSHRVLFNTVAPALSMFVAAHAFFAVAGVGPLAQSHAPITSVILPLSVLAVVYFGLNSGLVAGAVALEAQQPLVRIWRSFLWLGTGYLGAASVAFCLVLLIQQSSPVAVIIVLPLLVIFHLTLRASFGRLDDARHHLHAMDRLYLSTIETLAMAIDAKDDVTHSHVRRVQTLALALAREVGVTDDNELKAIEAAALLHDTGKLAVPEHILNKPGGLTDAEFDKMKLHADIGADILSLVGFPFPVVPIVRCHHENWDGTGYPNGVSGTDIPVGARILSVVDCFDALTSDRPYRKRLTNTDALQVLRERSGTMYDPDLVDTFFRIQATIAIAEEDAPAHRDVMQRIARARHTTQPAAPTVGVVPDQAQSELFAFVSLGRLVSGDATQEDVLALASHLMAQIVPDASGAWFLPDREHDRLVAAGVFGPAAGVLRGMTLGVGERLSGWVAASRQVIVNSPAALDLGERASLVQPPLLRTLSVPLASGPTLVAVLTLYSADDRAFDDQRARLVQIVAPHIVQALVAVSGQASGRKESVGVESLRAAVRTDGVLSRLH
jgi:putative nucleotidyltransferase with HDIG domain